MVESRIIHFELIDIGLEFIDGSGLPRVVGLADLLIIDGGQEDCSLVANCLHEEGRDGLGFEKLGHSCG